MSALSRRGAVAWERVVELPAKDLARELGGSRASLIERGLRAVLEAGAHP